MFVNANYEVQVGKNVFPVIGEIGIAEVNGKDCTVIVREIRSMEWIGESDNLRLQVKVIVEINDSNIIKQQEEKGHGKQQSKFRVIEGGKG
ncbi:hypothetical protein [Ornithinibacillus contaminans]|uniref:hypothetical protein n=1 Tax=Ornithinibacillus contaminans TaxID=694055 RepID=UPI00064DC60F|nr:hypothetical protein [Ornithinibacillus contaminans]